MVKRWPNAIKIRFRIPKLFIFAQILSVMKCNAPGAFIRINSVITAFFLVQIFQIFSVSYLSSIKEVDSHFKTFVYTGFRHLKRTNNLVRVHPPDWMDNGAVGREGVGWMDGLGLRILFNSISVIAGRWKGDH